MWNAASTISRAISFSVIMGLYVVVEDLTQRREGANWGRMGSARQHATAAALDPPLRLCVFACAPFASLPPFASPLPHQRMNPPKPYTSTTSTRILESI